jgi:hypothetical protein
MPRKPRNINLARLVAAAGGQLNPAAVPPVLDRPDADLSRLPLREIRNDPENERRLINAVNSYLRTYYLGECSVLVTRERGRWHLSIAHRSRLPTWDECSESRYRLIPDDCCMALLLPPRAEYTNVHRFCLQMTEIEPRPE